jgi:hypothetical protein
VNRRLAADRRAEFLLLRRRGCFVRESSRHLIVRS